MGVIKEQFCKQCNKELSKTQTKFCCSSCAATYNNIHRVSSTKGKTKILICSECGKRYEGSIHTNLTRIHFCAECKKDIRENKICPFCGNIFHNKHSKYCSEECKFYSKYIKILSKYFKIDKTHIGTSTIFEDIEKIREWLYNEYWIKEKTSTEISKQIGYTSPQNLTAKLMRNLNIPSRTWSQATSLNHLNGSLPVNDWRTCFKHGWHSTWDNNEVYLRSSYEFEYAEQLDSNKIHYEVESLRIKYFDSQKNDYRCAIPDFYIPSINTIVEIKSTYTLDLQNMKDKFRSYQEQGYKTRLILDHKEVDINTLTNQGQGWLLQ